MWLRVDDKFPDHPKVRGLDATALAVWLCVACWSAEYEQNGKVPLQVARQLAARFDPQESLLTGEPPVVSRLVAVGLWERTDIGYMVHDFLEYNPSKSDLDKRRKRERSRRRKGYRDKVSAHRRVARNVLPTTPHVASTRTRPVPVPDPDTTRDLKDVGAVAHLVDLFRTIPGVTPRANDGGLIAGLVTRHGAEHVELVIRDADVSIGAATNPLQYLAGACRRPRLVKPAAPPKERAWLDEVDAPDLTPEQLEANQVRIRGLVAEAMGKMP